MSKFKKLVALLDKYLSDEDRVGRYFTTITTQFSRVIISVIAGLLVYPLALFDLVSGVNLLPFWLWTLVGIMLAIYIGWNEEAFNIPANHVGIMTFLDRRYAIYLKEGGYTWIGRRFFIDVTNQPLPGAKNVQAGDGELQGRVFIGQRILQIWNDRTTKNINISLPARAGSSVIVNLTITVRTVDPMLWASADDPILKISEQARAGLRKAVQFFRDTDIAGAKSAVAALIEGDRVVTAFTMKKSGSQLFGTMVQEKSGVPMYRVIKMIKKGEDITAYMANIQVVKEEFRQEVARLGNPELLKAASDSEGLVVAVLNIEESVDEVMEKVGVTLDKIVISDAQLSQVVREASERAAAEGAQREAQLTSAETQSEVIRKLSEAREGLKTDDLDRLIAATQDGNEGIQIIHVTGNNTDLVKGLVAGGQQIGGKK